MLTEIEKEIINIFKARGITRDDMLGFTSILDASNTHKEMLEWLKANPEAQYKEIDDKITEIWERI